MTKLRETGGWCTQVDHVIDLEGLSAHHIVASIETAGVDIPSKELQLEVNGPSINHVLYCLRSTIDVVCKSFEALSSLELALLHLGIVAVTRPTCQCGLWCCLKIYKLLYVLPQTPIVAATINDMWKCHVEPYLEEAYRIFLG
jgi:hypothetical protein